MNIQTLKRKAQQATAAATVAVLSVPAMAAEGDLLSQASTEMSGLKTGVVAFGVVIVGIFIGIASIGVVKRVINRA